ncbi:hypothetical protein [Serratia nevei]|uniref:hypothetical protein n=1 Tax=Serratia nevei TaxID=2703794 RepID=UPI00254CEAFE|nr:hypothetical protein [Serratia nevei]MDK5224919.1 hypothetical protein [Serratia nevei]MEC5690063.1 hypothetical protein [Serratia nevei]
MATAQQNQAQSLAQEIAKIQADLLEKQKTLQNIQQSEIDKLVSKFLEDVEKSGFDRVLVKKIVVEKFTRKHKKRS